MEAFATFRHIRTGPRKLRLVTGGLRGKPVQEALNILKFSKKTAARDVSKLIRSALANANQKDGVSPGSLYVKKIVVNQGPIIKRWMTRARGSSAKIQKKMSHMTVVLEEKI